MFLGYCSAIYGECLVGVCKPFGAASNVAFLKDIALKAYQEDCKDKCGQEADTPCQDCMTSSAETDSKSLDLSFNDITTLYLSGGCPWYKAVVCTARILAEIPLCPDPLTIRACIANALGIASYCTPCICDVVHC